MVGGLAVAVGRGLGRLVGGGADVAGADVAGAVVGGAVDGGGLVWGALVDGAKDVGPVVGGRGPTVDARGGVAVDGSVRSSNSNTPPTAATARIAATNATSAPIKPPFRRGAGGGTDGHGLQGVVFRAGSPAE